MISGFCFLNIFYCFCGPGEVRNKSKVKIALTVLWNENKEFSKLYGVLVGLCEAWERDLFIQYYLHLINACSHLLTCPI